jgi:hypothetical protein
MNINDCKGCYSNNKGLGVSKCTIRHDMKQHPDIFTDCSGICPCATCIVKMVCNSGCPEYNTYIERIKGPQKYEAKRL